MSTCLHCGAGFYFKYQKARKFCSRGCSNVSGRGHRLPTRVLSNDPSPEWRAGMDKARERLINAWLDGDVDEGSYQYGLIRKLLAMQRVT